MGYIRDDADYYRSVGYTPAGADAQVKADNGGADRGFCNKKKHKLADEAEDAAKKQETK